MSSSAAALRRKPGFKLAVIAFVLAIGVVMLGAFTRLVDAGLGCPDWPGCYGHLLWPVQEHHVERANEAWPDHPVEHDKTWPEMVHRYFAGALGMLIAIIAFSAWRHREQRDYPFRLPILLLFVVVWQALFGMWTVTLKLWPQIVTLHLMGGMTVLSLLWLLVNRLDNVSWGLGGNAFRRATALKPLVIACIVIVAFQIMLGGWTAANYAAFGCPDFPTCHGDWWPQMDMARGFDVLQTIGPNYLGGQLENDARVAIHFSHRLGAILVAVAVIFLALRTLAIGDARFRTLAWIVLGVLALQIALGITNVLMRIPLAVAVAHNAGGGALLLALVTLATRLWTAQDESVEQDA